MVIPPFLVMNCFSVKDVNIAAVIPSFENDQDTYGDHGQGIAEDKDGISKVERVDCQQNNP
jgi:hypothetical protein